jgi:hypothetical protein
MLAKKKQNQNDISATVADDHLVLSLPTAIEPVIWRKSLKDIGSTTFEVKKAPKKDIYNLTLKKTKTTSETIASFDSKEDAVDALNAASKAFHNKDSSKKSSKSSNSADQNNASGGGKKWIYALIALLVSIGLYTYMSKLIPQETTFTNNNTASTSPNSGPITPDSTGVPVSADDFLSNMQ